MIKHKNIIVLLLSLPTIAFAINLDSFYITAKGGVSKTRDAGMMNFINVDGDLFTMEDVNLGTGRVFGLSLGKYLTDNIRLELEAIKRTGYKFNSNYVSPLLKNFTEEAKIDSSALFINGFYNFPSFYISNVPISPYIGTGIGISRNKMGTDSTQRNGAPTGGTFNGNTISQFAYKFSAGALFSLTEDISLDVNYQYVDLGAFKSGTEVSSNAVGFPDIDFQKPFSGGEIKAQELMIGLQYNF